MSLTREDVQILFDKGDKDKSGKLTFAEFKIGMLELPGDEEDKKKFQMEGVAEMIFDALGGDENKELTVDIVMKMVDENLLDEKKMLERMLRNADKDTDGYISLEELRKLLLMLDTEGRGPEAVNKLALMIMRVCDADDTKKAKPEAIMEFLSLAHDDQKDPKQVAKTLFKMFDTNSDGYITKKELREYMELALGPSGENDEDITMEEELGMSWCLDLIIEEYDADNDGKLNFEEFSGLVNDNTF